MDKKLRDEIFLKEALKLARRAFFVGEVPVGAVVVKDGTIIGRGFNQKESLKDPTAHAEIVAIREACSVLGDWRLEGCTLFCTLEPCVMCCGAIIQARIDRVVYCAADPKFGGVESLYNLLSDKRSNHVVQYQRKDVKEAVELLRRFFKKLREGEVPESG